MTTRRLSVVIPTRQRADTLQYTLETCLAQDFDDYEIVVCDNCSSPETQQVVQQAASDRIVYIRAPRPLAMSRNWDLAVSRARGEYITVLGDDDGLLPYALRALNDLACQHDARAIRWDRGIYSWPSYPLAEDANVLRFPLVRQSRWCDGHEEIQRVARFAAGYDTLPMIYNSIVRRDVIEQLRRKAGCVFPSTSPDVYSGFACAYEAREYLSVTVPMNLAGLSGHSNGVANLVLNKDGSVAEEFYRLNGADSIQLHPLVPDLASDAIAVADGFLSAKDRLFPNDHRLTMDRRQMLEAVLRSVTATAPDERRKARETIRQTIGADSDLSAWFDALPDPPPAPRWSPRPPSYGNDGFLLNLRADRCGVTNIAEAARFVAAILNFGDGPIPYDLPSIHHRSDVNGSYRRVKGRVVREIRRVLRQGAEVLRWMPERDVKR